MRIVHEYSLNNKRSDGRILILCVKEHLCEGCGNPMQCKDRRERIGLTYDGERNTYLVRRMYCKECRHMHTELPDFLVKYKHYEAKLIEEAIDGEDFSDHSNPVPDTIRRWRIWFEQILPFLEAALESLYADIADCIPTIISMVFYVDAVRANGEGWLVTILSTLINAGKYPEPRSIDRR